MTTLDSVSVATDKTKRKELNNAIPRVTNKCDNSVNNLEINTDKNTHQTASKYSKIRKVDKVNRLDETNANNTSDNGTLINAQGAENLECLNQTPENVRQTSGTDPSEVRNTDEATKPSKRKRKRGKIQPPLPPPDVVLPQCLVCGSNSSGFHYGANTCEACKGFFRRTLKKKEVRFACICNDEERKEHRHQVNSVVKNACPDCRYEKCLAVAIKIGRYTLKRISENISHVKNIAGGEKDSGGPSMQIGEKNSGDPNTSTNYTCSSGSSVTSVTPIHSSPESGCETTTLTGCSESGHVTTTLIGCSNCASPAKTSRLTGELCLHKIDRIVKKLYHAHKCLENTEPSITKTETVQRHQKDYFEQYQLKRELFGPMRPISKEEYFGLYNSTGIEIDSRKEFVQEAVSYFADSISKLVDFAKCIPGFRELPLQDQANLIKVSRFECSILALKHQVFNSDFNVVTTPWGKSMHVDELSQTVSKDFLFAKLTIKQKVEKLDLSPEEEAILTGVVITFPDRCELSEPEAVQNIQYKLLTCLQHLIRVRPTNKPNKVARIFNLLISLRDVSKRESEILKEMCIDWPMEEITEKFESRVIECLRDNDTEVNAP